MPAISAQTMERHHYTGRRAVCAECGRGRRAAIHTRQHRENSELIAFMRRMIRAMGRRAAADIETLPKIIDLQAQLEHELHRAVAQCRLEGYSWSEIADRLGVTKQAACSRFGK